MKKKKTPNKQPPIERESMKSSADEELTPQAAEALIRKLKEEGRMPSFKQVAEVLNDIAEKLAKGEDLSDPADDSPSDTLRRVAWRVVWDGGTPIHNGEFVVYLIQGKYWFDGSDYGEGQIGPSDDLSALLEENGLNCVTDTTVSISSPLLSAEELVRMLKVEAEVGQFLSVNSEMWYCAVPGVLLREGEEWPRDDPAQLKLPF